MVYSFFAFKFLKEVKFLWDENIFRGMRLERDRKRLMENFGLTEVCRMNETDRQNMRTAQQEMTRGVGSFLGGLYIALNVIEATGDSPDDVITAEEIAELSLKMGMVVGRLSKYGDGN